MMMRKTLIRVLPAVAALAAGAVLWSTGPAAAQSAGAAGTQQALLIPNSPIQPLQPQTGLDPRKIALGERLFTDPRLSRDNTVSCATCHDVANGGEDGLDASVGIGGARTSVNSPTVLNSSLNFAQFWDGRADSLEGGTFWV